MNHDMLSERNVDVNVSKMSKRTVKKKKGKKVKKKGKKKDKNNKTIIDSE